jgi:hypothetical protein
MALILAPNGRVAHQVPYQLEEAFERDVVQLADHIFGPSLYIDIKRRVGNDIVTALLHSKFTGLRYQERRRLRRPPKARS